ncbi:MAG: GAF domain-containing protein [Anaerolineales bacterium]|nr:GAF domain-containing protein [Anaerolineales bacterium]
MINKPLSPSYNNDAGGRQSFDLKTWRERFILAILRIASIFGVVLIVISFPTSTLLDKFLYVGLYLVLLGITILPSPYILRANLLLLISFAVGINTILAWGPWKDGNIFLLSGIILAAILLDRRVDIVALITAVTATTVIAILQQIGLFQFTAVNVPPTRVEDWVGYIADFSIAGAAIVVAVGQFKEVFMQMILNLQNKLGVLSDEQDLLRERVRERSEELETRMSQLRTSANTSRQIAETKDFSELLQSSVTMLSERFGYYHVGLYILDEQKKTAFLQAASSEAGRQLVGQSFSIKTDRRNPIHYVVRQNRPSITTDLDHANFIRDENFPLTRARMVLPLAVRGEVLGLFDIHADQPRAFTLQDADILQPVADLTAISFDNLRLVNETQSLLSQLDINTALQTQRTWAKLTSRQKPSYQYTPAGVRPVFSSDKHKDHNGLRIPLVLHGQKIGTIKLKRKGTDTDWSEKEHNLLLKIADQVSLALENSRLVDEAQKSAMRDQMIASISTQIRETLDIESVIRTATSELRRVFDLKEAEIVVGSPQSEA